MQSVRGWREVMERSRLTGMLGRVCGSRRSRGARNGARVENQWPRKQFGEPGVTWGQGPAPSCRRGARHPRSEGCSVLADPPGFAAGTGLG